MYSLILNTECISTDRPRWQLVGNVVHSPSDRWTCVRLVVQPVLFVPRHGIASSCELSDVTLLISIIRCLNSYRQQNECRLQSLRHTKYYTIGLQYWTCNKLLESNLRDAYTFSVWHEKHRLEVVIGFLCLSNKKCPWTLQWFEPNQRWRPWERNDMWPAAAWLATYRYAPHVTCPPIQSIVSMTKNKGSLVSCLQLLSISCWVVVGTCHPWCFDHTCLVLPNSNTCIYIAPVKQKSSEALAAE